nr:uncharacterized protein LOC127341679 isoform X2 [Lolium perenne]
MASLAGCNSRRSLRMVCRTTANGVFRRRNGLPFSARCAADRRRARSWKYRDQYYRRPAAPPVRVLRQSEGEVSAASSPRPSSLLARGRTIPSGEVSAASSLDLLHYLHEEGRFESGVEGQTMASATKLMRSSELYAPFLHNFPCNLFIVLTIWNFEIR